MRLTLVKVIVMNVRLYFPLKLNFNLEYPTVHVFLTLSTRLLLTIDLNQL